MYPCLCRPWSCLAGITVAIQLISTVNVTIDTAVDSLQILLLDDAPTQQPPRPNGMAQCLPPIFAPIYAHALKANSRTRVDSLQLHHWMSAYFSLPLCDMYTLEKPRREIPNMVQLLLSGCVASLGGGSRSPSALSLLFDIIFIHHGSMVAAKANNKCKW